MSVEKKQTLYSWNQPFISSYFKIDKINNKKNPLTMEYCSLYFEKYEEKKECEGKS